MYAKSHPTRPFSGGYFARSRKRSERSRKTGSQSGKSNKDRAETDIKKDGADTKITAKDKPETDYAYLLKVVLMGNSGVGKSTLLSRFGNIPTAVTRRLILDGELIVAQIWNTTGDHMFHARTTPYQGTKGALVVYNVTDRSTFEDVGRWLMELRAECDPNIVVMLVGNMIDDISHREVSSEEGKSFAERESLYFIETSAKESINVYEAFSHLITMIYLKKVGKKSITTIEGKGMGIVAMRNYLVQKNLIVQQFEIHETNTDTSSTTEGLVRPYDDGVGDVDCDFNATSTLPETSLSSSLIADGHVIGDHLPNEEQPTLISPEDGELLPFQLVQQSEIHRTNTNTSSAGLVRAYDDGAGDADSGINVILTLPETSLPSYLISDGHIIGAHWPNKENPAFSSPEDEELLPFHTKSEDEISAPKDNHNDQSARVMNKNFAVTEILAFENHDDSSTSETCDKHGASNDTISEISDLINYNDQSILENRGTSPAVRGNDEIGLSTIFKMEEIKDELKHSSLNTVQSSNAKPNLRPAEDIAYYMYWEHITWSETSPMASPACLHQPTSCHFCKIFELWKLDSDENSYYKPVKKAVSEKVEWFQEKRKNTNICHECLDQHEGKELESKEVESKKPDKIVKKHAKHWHITSRNKSFVISRRKLSPSTVSEVLDSENQNEQTLAIKGTSKVVHGFGVSDSGQINMKDTINKINYGHITYNFQGQIRKYVARKKRLTKLPQLSRASNYKRGKEAFTWVTIGCLTLSSPLLLFLLYRRRSIKALT